MEEITIHLLGTLYVERDGEIVETFKTDVERALLARLALARGVPLRRDQLAALFSPDRTNRDARIYLSNAFGRLRKALNTPALFGSNRHELWLEGGAWVDSAEFITLHNAVQTHPHRALAGCQLCLDRLQRAADLYRGELLTGFYFDSDLWDSWLLTQREHFQQRAVEILTQLADAQAQRGAWEAVQPVARQLLTIEAWHEGAHRYLIAAYLAQGDRGAAVAQFEQCAAILAEELGVEPSAETLALLEQDQRVAQAEIPVVLPSWETPFFGRSPELEQLQTLLTDPHYRFVTLVGEGGVGKSRLAVEAARRLRNSYPDGVFFVPLAGLATDEAAALEMQISGAIASAVGLTFTPQGSPQSQLFNYLRDKSLLLVLDNWEHVIDGAGVVRELLTRARTISVLCTSRQPLGFQAEQIVWLDGLPLPEVEGDAARFSLVQLFAERAQRVARRFELSAETITTIVQIGRLLDGNPLGIELAAATLQRQTLEQTWQGILWSMDTLKTHFRDISPRQRSLRALFMHSWSLLTADEQTLFAKLSVFRGGFTLESADAVADATRAQIVALTTKSLVQTATHNRFTIHETLREYAAEQLHQNRPLAAALTLRHGTHFAELVAAQHEPLRTSAMQHAAAQIERDFANVRHAWNALARQQQAAQLYQMTRPLFLYMYLRRRYQELDDLLRHAYERLTETSAMVLRARALIGCARGMEKIAMQLGEREERIRLVEEALAIAAETGDTSLAVTAWVTRMDLYETVESERKRPIFTQGLAFVRQALRPYELTQALMLAGNFHTMSNEFDTARPLIAEGIALAQANDFSLLEAQLHFVSGTEGMLRFDWELVQRERTLAYEQFKQVGDESSANETLIGLARNQIKLGQHTEAANILEQTLQFFRQRGDDNAGVRAEFELGALYCSSGDYTKSLHYYHAARQRPLAQNNPYALAGILNGTAKNYGQLGAYERAKLSIDEARSVIADLNPIEEARVIGEQAHHAVLRRDFRQAERYFQAFAPLAEQAEVTARGVIMSERGHVALGRRDYTLAKQHFSMSLEIFESANATNAIASLQASLLFTALELEDVAEVRRWVEPLYAHLERDPQHFGARRGLWSRYVLVRALIMLQDARHEAFVRQSVDILMSRAERIDDPALRRSYLEDVAWNRAIAVADVPAYDIADK